MQLSGEKKQNFLLGTGIFLVIFSLLLFFLIFYPIIKAEFNFAISEKKADREIKLNNTNDITGDDAVVPASFDFGLIIPKLEINSKVIANVDPFSEREYQKALKDGVAHAKGTDFPGAGGNIFLFAHSSGNFYEVSRTNPIFFLLNKLEKADNISIVYQNQIFKYRVLEKKNIASDAVEYLTKKTDAETLTLMTCWPPGTDYGRLLVLAERAQ